MRAFLLTGAMFVASTGDAGYIFTAEDLQAIPDGSFSVYTLANDIDASTISNFKPIHCFSGELDGQGHVIRNLTIKYPAKMKIGLFDQCYAPCVGYHPPNLHDFIIDNAQVEAYIEAGPVMGVFCGMMTRVAVVGGTNYVGGLVGIGGASGPSSYWDVETTGQAGSLAGSGKTTSAMQTQSTFLGWNFSTIWPR